MWMVSNIKKMVAAVLTAVFCMGIGVGCELNFHNKIDPAYGNTVAYAGWADDDSIYEGALNKDILQGRDGEHLPIFKMDTLEELAEFKDNYGDIFTMDQGRDKYLSFDGAVAKAQWDNEAFYNEYTMLAVYIPATSGSSIFYVADVQAKDDSFCVYVAQEDKGVASEDMAGWFILMQIKDEEMSGYTDFNAVLNKDAIKE